MLSGGLDSQLAVCVLRGQGCHVEGVVFDSPFFNIQAAHAASRSLSVPLQVIDFTADIADSIGGFLAIAVMPFTYSIANGIMLGMLSYSRGQETAADETALATLQAHYGSIAGGIEMYDLLAQKAGETPKRKWLPNWLATHPDTVKRQEHLRDYAQRHGYNPQGNTTPNPWLKPNAPQ